MIFSWLVKELRAYFIFSGEAGGAAQERDRDSGKQREYKDRIKTKKYQKSITQPMVWCIFFDMFYNKRRRD